jgi:hypothetical protein
MTNLRVVAHLGIGGSGWTESKKVNLDSLMWVRTPTLGKSRRENAVLEFALNKCLPKWLLPPVYR